MNLSCPFHLQPFSNALSVRTGQNNLFTVPHQLLLLILFSPDFVLSFHHFADIFLCCLLSLYLRTRTHKCKHIENAPLLNSSSITVLANFVFFVHSSCLLTPSSILLHGLEPSAPFSPLCLARRASKCKDCLYWLETVLSNNITRTRIKDSPGKTLRHPPSFSLSLQSW